MVVDKRSWRVAVQVVQKVNQGLEMSATRKIRLLAELSDGEHAARKGVVLVIQGTRSFDVAQPILIFEVFDFFAKLRIVGFGPVVCRQLRKPKFCEVFL
jgi:hypothetical protein